MKQLARPFWVVLALVFLFEAWLWDVLAPVAARIVGVIPFGRLKPTFIGFVARLSPRATVLVLAIPVIVLLPVKVLEVWLLTHRHFLAAIAVLVSAKLVGVGMTAFIFDAVRDKLLTMAWFRRLYAFVMWARGWAHDKIEPVTRQLAEWSRTTTEPLLRALKGRGHPRLAGRLVQRVMRLRRRMGAAT